MITMSYPASPHHSRFTMANEVFVIGRPKAEKLSWRATILLILGFCGCFWAAIGFLMAGIG